MNHSDTSRLRAAVSSCMCKWADSAFPLSVLRWPGISQNLTQDYIRKKCWENKKKKVFFLYVNTIPELNRSSKCFPGYQQVEVGLKGKDKNLLK